jgi:hypothetical protein
MRVTRRAHEVAGPSVEDGSPRRVTIVGAALVIAFFVATYAHQAISFDRDALISDQWVWVESVLMPYQRGDMGLFDAVTWEFAPLSHSHIPSLAVFLFSYEFLDLDLSADRIIGFLALVAMLVIVFRHSREFLRLDVALVVTAVASSILFMSSNPVNFGWSLLQFQLFYVLVAFVYLRSFTIRYETQPFAHAMIAMPAALLLGDAIGVAAVVATLAYLLVLGVLRKAPKRALVAYLGLFPLQLLLLSAVFSGERSHHELPILEFVESGLRNPGEFLGGLYYSMSTVFVALRPDGLAGPLLGWGHATPWFALTVAIGGLAMVLVWRTPLRTHDRFGILVILTGVIWTVGVLRARAFVIEPAHLRPGGGRALGAAAMQAPRYAVYTTLIGVGLILLLASKLRFQPRLRAPLMVVAAFVVLANGLGSLKLVDNQRWVAEQERQVTDLRAYVLDETQEFDPPGRRCTQPVSCLRAASWLYDEKLASFRGDPSPRPAWVQQLRELAFARYDDMAVPDERRTVCIRSKVSNDHDLFEWLLNSPLFGLTSVIQRAGLEIPDDEQAEAERLVVRLVRDQCRQPTEPRG